MGLLVHTTTPRQMRAPTCIRSDTYMLLVAVAMVVVARARIGIHDRHAHLASLSE